MVANFIYRIEEHPGMESPLFLPRSGEKLAVTKGKNGCKVGGSCGLSGIFLVHGWLVGDTCYMLHVGWLVGNYTKVGLITKKHVVYG